MQPLNLKKVGLAQRLVIRAVLALFFVPLIIFIPHSLIGHSAIVIMWFLSYCVWRISSALQFNALAKTFCLLLSIIPLINIILLLVLNGKAKRVLKGAGIRVGLWVTNVNDLNENHIQPLTSKDPEENARELEKLDQEWEEMGVIKLAHRLDMLWWVGCVICIVGLGFVCFGVWLIGNETFLVKMFPRLIGARLIENTCDPIAENVGFGVVFFGVAGVFGSLALIFCHVGPKSDAVLERAKSYHFRRQELLEEIATSVRSENSRNEEHKPPD